MSKLISGDIKVEIEWSFKSGSPSHVFVYDDHFDKFTRHDIVGCAVAGFYSTMLELGVSSSELLVSVLCVYETTVGGRIIH